MWKSDRPWRRPSRRYVSLLAFLFVAVSLSGCLDGDGPPSLEAYEQTALPLDRAPTDGASQDGTNLDADGGVLRITGDQMVDRLAKRFAWPGSGIPADPYRMADLTLTDTTLLIEGVGRALSIVDADLSGPDGHPAVLLVDTNGITIEDSRIATTGAAAIEMTSGAWLRIEGTTLESDRAGFTSQGATSIDIVDSTIRSGQTGLLLTDDGGNHWLERVTIEAATTGIDLSRAEHPSVLVDVTVRAPTGVRVEGAPGPYVDDLDFVGQTGIVLIDSPEATIFDSRLDASTVAVAATRTDALLLEGVRLAGPGGIFLEDGYNILIGDLRYNGTGTAVHALRGHLVVLVDSELTRRDGQGPVVRFTGTDAAFVIDGGLAGGDDALLLDRTKDATVVGASVFGAARNGIHGLDTTGTIVSDVHISFSHNGTLFERGHGAIVAKSGFQWLNGDAGVIFTDHPDGLVVENRIDRAGQVGIRLIRAEEAILSDNRIDATPTGIDAHDSQGPIIMRNQVAGPSIGMAVRGTERPIEGAVLQNNVFHGLGTALVLENAQQHLVQTNTFFSNGRGLRLTDVTQTLVYDNYFDNGADVVAAGTIDIAWSVEPTAGPNVVGGALVAGNWWHDYTGMDHDGDGLGDTPYTFAPYDENTQPALRLAPNYGAEDDLPLVGQGNAPSIPLQAAAPDPALDRLLALLGQHDLLDARLEPHLE